jgi:hypothetical protein
LLSALIGRKMGNAVTKKYDIPTQHSATAGFCQLFKIYNGTEKETGKEVSVWNFSKDELGKRKPPISEKAVLEQLYGIIRRDITALKDIQLESTGVLRPIEVYTLFFGMRI